MYIRCTNFFSFQCVCSPSLFCWQRLAHAALVNSQTRDFSQSKSTSTFFFENLPKNSTRERRGIPHACISTQSDPSYIFRCTQANPSFCKARVWGLNDGKRKGGGKMRLVRVGSWWGRGEKLIVAVEEEKSSRSPAKTDTTSAPFLALSRCGVGERKKEKGAGRAEKGRSLTATTPILMVETKEMVPPSPLS